MAAARLDVYGILEGARLVVLGGTGFLGKVFWAMLLDRYPGVGRIYLVVRPKGPGESSTPEGRFWSEIAPSEATEPLRRAHGDGFAAFLREKVVPIDGDMGQPLCGLGEERVRELSGTIDAVVNVAGVIDFSPPLDEALEANAFGAQNLVALARALGNAPVFHTSTCYVAGSRAGPILEEHPCVHPFPRADELGADLWDPDREIAECLDLVAQATHRCDDAFRQSEFAERARQNLERRGEPAHGEPYSAELGRVRRKFIADRLVEAGLDRATHWGWPNIYTYTKAIGEQVIARSGLPFTLARPASCESSLEFPERGYNEGATTSAPLIYLIMKGEAQILGGHVPLDLIPTDYVVAGMIVALAELLEGTAKPVYQFGGADVNPCTVQRFGEMVGLYKRRHYRQSTAGNPFVNALQGRFEPSFVDRPRFDRMGSPAIAGAAHRVASLVRRAGPSLAPAAKVLESVSQRQAKIAHVQKLFEPFTTKVNGPFDCSNTRAAYARLGEEDRQKLPWAPEAIDWADWMMNVHMPAMERRIIPEIDRRSQKPPRALAPHATLVTLVDEMAERHGHAVALQRTTDDGLTRVSFADVALRARAVAGRLAAAGIAKGDRVALSAENGPEWAIAYFGIVRAGGTVVPVDPSLDASAWLGVLDDSGAGSIIWDATVKALAEVEAARPRLVTFAIDAATQEGAEHAAPSVTVEPSDLASLIYTSGTTGRPKGVRLTHKNFTALVAALAPIFPLSAADAVLSVLPLHHTFEFTCGLLLPFSRGARIVYLGELTGDRLVDGLRSARATAMVGVPAVWQLLERRILQRVDEQGQAVRAAFDLATDANRWLSTNVGFDAGRLLFGAVHRAMGGRIRWLISGGAALPRETYDRYAGLGMRLTEGYGLTEAAPVLAVGRPDRAERGVGRALPGVDLKIADPDERGVGEVLARGANVMAGYTDGAATRQAIDPEGWLHTGDLGRLDAKGRLQIVGRIKDVVISTNGENVHPEEVERRLGAVPDVAELAVVGLDVRGTERVACLAVPAGERGADRAARSERARSALRRAIDDLPFGLRPVVVHLYDAPLPRTATRKVKRDEVRAILSRMVVASSRPENGAGALNPVRVAVAGVRGLPPKSLVASATLRGDLDFDSLAMTELLEVLEGRFGAIDPQRLERCETVGDVEELVKAPPPGDARPSGRAAASTSAPPIVLPKPVQEIGKAFIGKLQDVFYGEVMKPRVYGRAYIPHNRNVIVVANHSSHLDMGFVRHALGSYGDEIVSLAAQDYFFESGIKRAFFENLTNLKPIDRRASLRQAIRQAAEVIERGRTVLVFPEGTRSSTGEIQEFKPLVGHLALVHGVDILPVFLGGTHSAMPKGAPLPAKREIVARVGPPLCVADLRRLTQSMPPADAAREVARVARAAVLALSDGTVLDIAGAGAKQDLVPEREHPLIALFAELEGKFRAGEVERAVSYYVSLGNDELAKWTVRVDPRGCDVRPGKPDGQADCVLKTSPEIFTKIVRESYIPSPADFLAGVIKSNDVGLLLTFQKVFQLDQPS
ncbi:MAG TPA: AMP-binding protein [Polyangiaceae bacterium]|nr:AMP-binding protein [Polyangiaceae bacterium]